MIRNKYAELAKKFADMNPKEQKKYLDDHPNSPLKVGSKAPASKTKPAATKAPAKAPAKAHPPAAKTPVAKAPKPAAAKAPATKSKTPKSPAPTVEAKPKAKAPAAVTAPKPKKKTEGFYPKNSWKPPKKGPGVMDTLKEMFGTKRTSYANLLRFVDMSETAADIWATMSREERRVYLRGNPTSRFAEKAADSKKGYITVMFEGMLELEDKVARLMKQAGGEEFGRDATNDDDVCWLVPENKLNSTIAAIKKLNLRYMAGTLSIDSEGEIQVD